MIYWIINLNFPRTTNQNNHTFLFNVMIKYLTKFCLHYHCLNMYITHFWKSFFTFPKIFLYLKRDYLVHNLYKSWSLSKHLNDQYFIFLAIKVIWVIGNNWNNCFCFHYNWMTRNKCFLLIKYKKKFQKLYLMLFFRVIMWFWFEFLPIWYLVISAHE